MELRTYQATDVDACLAVFESNFPEFFHPSERQAFAAFLDAPQGDYLVAEHDGVIVGCGGVAMEHAELASVTWLMVRRDLHKNGVGRLLLFSGIRRLPALGDPTMLRLHTTPQIAGFFRKLGFHEVERVPDGFAPGLDRVEMLKKLRVCA